LGKEQQLGKPVGSDVREGKKTTIVFFALKAASADERRLMLSVLGNADASAGDVERVTETMVSLGAVDRTAELALEHVNAALPELDTLPDSHHKELLSAWARYMIERRF
jgi:geranylgeranyl diphosphate synthase type I